MEANPIFMDECLPNSDALSNYRFLVRTYCLEVHGDYACFTRPEMKVERVSYDVITPSAARAIFEAILWKPAIRWQIRQIEVLTPIQWISIRRNEVASKLSVSNAKSAMNAGRGNLAILIEEDRQQRAGMLLRKVRYRLHAELQVLPGAGEGNTPPKFWDMFERRASAGQCFHQPYLGCREFPAHFQLVDPAQQPAKPIDETRDLGFMLYDLDYTKPNNPMPLFFRAQLTNGTITVPDFNSKEVHR